MKLKCKTIKKIPLIASLAFLTGCTTTPEPKLFTSDADRYAYVKEYMRWYINEQMEEKDIVGLSIALVDDQKIVWSEGFGYADKAKGIKSTPQTRYRAGSITKLFNAMAVMKLQEQGKMNIDKPLKTYLPEFSIKSRFGSTDGITPRNIMTHHSGLPSEWMDRMFATKPLMYTELADEIKNEYVAYKPNTIFSYSNLAVSLLGDAVEKVSGTKYVDYVSKVLLNPLYMKYSDLDTVLEGGHISKAYNKDKEVKEFGLGMVPGGGLNSTVEDLAHLAMMIHANGKYAGEQVLKASTLKQMFTVQHKDIAIDLDHKMGLGWSIDTDVLRDDIPVYGHGGAMIAHRAYIHVEPKSKLGVVIMANTASANVYEIANTFLQKSWEVNSGLKVKKKEQVIESKSNFSGTFTTMMGKVDISKESDSVYLAKTSKGEFTLNKNRYNLYNVKYKLLGLFPISYDEFKKASFYTQKIEGNELIIMNTLGKKILAGVKVKRHTIPEKWKTYVGHYKVMNNFEVNELKIEDVEFSIENGYAQVQTKYKSGESMTIFLKPVNDTEAIIEGLGRGMQETVYFKDGVFHAQGLNFKKIGEKK